MTSDSEKVVNFYHFISLSRDIQRSGARSLSVLR